MQEDDIFGLNPFASENKLLKKYLLAHYLERIFPMAKKFTRKEKEMWAQTARGNELLRTYHSTINRYNPDDAESVWEYENVRGEILKRLNHY